MNAGKPKSSKSKKPKKSKKRVPLENGMWLAVPLEDSGYALGIITHIAASGLAIGHFFGKRFAAAPTLDDAQGLQPSDAILICIVVTRTLKASKWPALGVLNKWRPSRWPIPKFRRSEDDGSLWIVHLNRRLLERRYEATTRDVYDRLFTAAFSTDDNIRFGLTYVINGGTLA